MSARDALSRGERRGCPGGADAASRVRLRAPGGRRVRAGRSEHRAARGGEVPASAGRLERSGAIWGDWGPEMTPDVFTSAVGKLPGCGWVGGKVSNWAVDAKSCWSPDLHAR